jgi:hydrogenase maturation protease
VNRDAPARGAPADIAPFVVIGIGNVLLGDDGFGPNVIGILQAKWDFPATVELIDAGTPGLDLADLLCGREVVVLVDAVNTGGTPGQMRCCLGSELDGVLALQPRVSGHDPALGDALAIARLAGGGPREVLLVGVVPETVELGVGLSESVAAAADTAAAAVAAHLAQWTAHPTPRKEKEVASPTHWWARDIHLAPALDGAATLEDG